MTEDNNFKEQLYEEAVALSRLVSRAAEANRTGSYLDRNPERGRMRTCPFCKQRRRKDETCCSGRVIPGTENDTVKQKGRKNPRLTENRPPLRETHQILVEAECDPNFKEYEGITGVVEAAIIRKKKARAKKKRDQQKRSRRINRG